MAYRGEDLDLRTPQSGGRPAADIGAGDLRSRASYGVRGEPVWVDDTILACCNLAFDLALTHRASEVRLEHLVYALTRIDAAAEALESLGVRVATLRRELGSLVASEIPIGAQNGKAAPRRSDDIDIVLRDAAALAHLRNAPASIDDLISTLIDSTRDLPALPLVRRHLGTRAASDRGDYEPAPRSRELSPRFAAPAAYDPRTHGVDVAGARREDDFRTSTAATERLTAIEQAIEKRFVEMSRSSAVLNERLAGIERALQASSGEGAQYWTATSERLVSLESTLLAQSANAAGNDMARLVERLDTIEQVVVERGSSASDEATQLAGRLKAIEEGQAAQKVQALQLNAALAAELSTLTATAAQNSGGSEALAQINERFQAIGAVLEQRQAENTRATASLAERIAAAERGMMGAAQKIAEQAGGRDADQGKLHEALAKLSTQQAALFGGIDQVRQASSELGVIGNRLAAIERLTTRPAQIIDQLAEKIGAIHHHTAEKSEKRSHFYVWLFGTKNWLAASWPEKGRSVPPT